MTPPKHPVVQHGAVTRPGEATMRALFVGGTVDNSELDMAREVPRG